METQFATYALIALTGLWLISLWWSFVRRDNKKSAPHIWFLNWLGGLSHELAGAVIGGIIVLLLVTMPTEYFNELEQKRDLIRQARIQNPDFSGPAIKEMQENDWFIDGTLENTSFSGAEWQDEVFVGAKLRGGAFVSAVLTNIWFDDSELQGANFSKAQLTDVRFLNADLSNSNFESATLTDVLLREAKLVDANMNNVTMISVDLEEANLENANLYSADLRGVDLQRANLVGADLTEAQFSEETILPNLTYWLPGTDMRQFTDPHHPGYFDYYSEAKGLSQ